GPARKPAKTLETGLGQDAAFGCARKPKAKSEVIPLLFGKLPGHLDLCPQSLESRLNGNSNGRLLRGRCGGSHSLHPERDRGMRLHGDLKNPSEPYAKRVDIALGLTQGVARGLCAQLAIFLFLLRIFIGDAVKPVGAL